MTKYTPEVREKALEMIKTLGINRTSNEMHIARQTLVRWKKQSMRSTASPSSLSSEDALGKTAAAAHEDHAGLQSNKDSQPTALIDEKLILELNDMQRLNQVSEATIEHLVNENRLLRQRCEKYLHALSLISQ